MRFGFDSETLLKLLEKLFLFGIEPIWVGEVDLCDQIPFPASMNIGNPFTTESILLAVFGPCFEFECDFAVQRGDSNIFAQNGLGEKYRNFEVDVVSVTDKVTVFFDFKRHVHIPSHTTFTDITATRYA